MFTNAQVVKWSLFRESRHALYINTPVIISCIRTGSVPYIMFMCKVKDNKRENDSGVIF